MDFTIGFLGFICEVAQADHIYISWQSWLVLGRKQLYIVKI